MNLWTLKEQIAGSYDDAMSDFLESDDYKQAVWELDKIYYAFRKKLTPDEQQELDNLFSISEEISQSAAEEALYRGIMIGISERDALLKTS